MSLINEALKKAQRQRSLDAAPLSSAPSGIAAAAVTTHVRAASHKRSFAPLWFGLGVLALGAGATVLVMRYGFGASGSAPTASSAVAPKPVAPAPVSPAPAAPIASAPAPAAVVADAPAIVLPPLSGGAHVATPAPAVAPPPPAAAPSPIPAPASPPVAVAVTASPAAASVAPVAAAQVAPVAPITKVAPVAAPASGGSEDRATKIQTFLDNARITGVRGGDKDARLLMNERVWRPGDTVAPELGLRLQAVRAGRIIFADTQGKTFEKAY